MKVNNLDAAVKRKSGGIQIVIQSK